MTELETRMRAMLEKTGLYFGEDKWLSAELAAYAKGLELVYDTLSHVRRDAFVQTAEEDGLKAFESLFRVVPSVDSTKNRRAMLLTRGAVTPQTTQWKRCKSSFWRQASTASSSRKRVAC